MAVSLSFSGFRYNNNNNNNDNNNNKAKVLLKNADT